MTPVVSLPVKPTDLAKPRMRGQLHAYGFWVAVAGGIVLCTSAANRPEPGPLISCTIYSVTVCALFATSALYHRRTWSPRGLRLMRRLDHSMIFLLIAGTYTPLCWLLLGSTTAVTMLTVIWTGAFGGVVLKMIWPYLPRSVGTPLYLALGWVGVTILPDILQSGGLAALVLTLAGGLAYSLGAICYALCRPDPWPTVFGYHEIFHACTLLAAACHHIAVWFALYR